MKIPAPTTADGLTAAEVARWHEDRRALEADPRTAGSANRPRWLVERVLRESKKRDSEDLQDSEG